MFVCVARTYSRDRVLHYVVILSAIKMVPLMQFNTSVFMVISKEHYEFQVLHTWGNLRTAFCVVIFKGHSYVFFSSNSQNNLQNAGLLHFLLWYVLPVLTFKHEAMTLGIFVNEDAYRFYEFLYVVISAEAASLCSFFFLSFTFSPLVWVFLSK